MPAERKFSAARSAAARDRNIPATVLIDASCLVLDSFILFAQLFQVSFGTWGQVCENFRQQFSHQCRKAPRVIIGLLSNNTSPGAS
jgi:hypothetical protein